MRNGIDFRRSDCYFSVDKKRFIQHQGLAGYAILQLLLDKIYYEEGYYIKWDSNALDDFSYDLKLQSSKVSEVVNYALHVGIFDKEKYKEFGVLTSLEIQNNYKIATYKRVNQWHNKKLCYKTVIQNNKTDSGNSKTDVGNGKTDVGNEREKSRVEFQSKVDKKKEIKKEKTSTIEIDKTILSHLQNLSNKLGKALTGQGLSKIDWQTIDFDRLENAVNESEFLTNSNNLDINWLLKHYDQIIAGNYKDFQKTAKAKTNSKAIITREYSKEELDSAFSKLDDDWNN